MSEMNFDIKADIFEFCESLYDELNARDNGYYAQIHDEIVMNAAAEKYNKTIGEIDKIYSEGTKKTAEIYTKKKGKMTKNQMMSEMMAIVRNNKSFPFRDDSNRKLPELKSHNDIILEEYENISKLLGENGWTIPTKFTFGDLDFISQITPSHMEYDNYFNTYYNDKNVKNIITDIKKTKQLSEIQEKLFDECVDVFWQKKYQLCVNGLISILEGCLSNIWSDKNNTKMMICKEYQEQSKSQHKPIKTLIWISVYNFIQSLYQKSEFEKDEPIIVNRHWVLHGRTQTEWERVDCIRLLVAIYTIVFISKKI